MKPKRHKYGNASQVKCHGKGYADGGRVAPKIELKPPPIKKVESPILKGKNPPGGPHTPGAKKARKK